MPGKPPYPTRSDMETGTSSRGCLPLSGRHTPFGRPVVPDEYSIACPAVSWSSRAVVDVAIAAS